MRGGNERKTVWLRIDVDVDVDVDSQRDPSIM